MQSATHLYGVPFAKKPRRGQQKVFELAAETDRNKLVAQLPTGYGKTFAAFGAFAIRHEMGSVDRLLYVTPTLVQHLQITEDGHFDLDAVGLHQKNAVVDVRARGVHALKMHRSDAAMVYAINVQQLLGINGRRLLEDLMSGGNWMIVIDELHRYGEDKSWSKAIKDLGVFTLAMSATPFRPGADGIFDSPNVVISYRDAVHEGAVKPMRGKAHNLTLDFTMNNGDIRSITTVELRDIVGTNDPLVIERHLENHKWRLSPKYVSPLVSVPIDRLMRERMRSGERLQALITASCVSHANVLCDQVAALYPSLRVDWVGTGPNGRSDSENMSLMRKFCPSKSNGVRPQPQLDVLVHVGIAGEGVDCINVSEIIHACNASDSNTLKQINGRASRYLEGITAYVSFDTAADLAADPLQYTGEGIMDLFDMAEGDKPKERDPKDDDNDREWDDWDDWLSPNPYPNIKNITLESIIGDDPMVVEKYTSAVRKVVDDLTIDARLDDPDDPIHERIKAMILRDAQIEAEKHNARAEVQMWTTNVKEAVELLAGKVASILYGRERNTASIRGDICKRINTYKKRVLGEIEEDIAVKKRHYAWIVELEQSINITHEIPTWLK
jgi:DNA or RNA helicases of superfamily II